MVTITNIYFIYTKLSSQYVLYAVASAGVSPEEGGTAGVRLLSVVGLGAGGSGLSTTL